MTNNYLMVKDERRASFSRGILTDKSPLIWSYIINIKIILQRDKRSKLWPILEKPWTICKSLVLPTGGHFACACVNPLNDNSVGASNLMAGNRKLAPKVTVLLKAISLVLWMPYFPTKNILHDKYRTFSTRVFTCRFFSSRFSWPLKTRLNAKSHGLYKSDFHWQSNAFLWFDFQTRGFI